MVAACMTVPAGLLARFAASLGLLAFLSCMRLLIQNMCFLNEIQID